MDEQQKKEMLRNTFDTISTGYDMPALKFFARSAEHLAVHLGLQGSEHVLDVATGTGTSAIALAEGLPDGQVTGVDFSEGMLRQAEVKLEAGGLGNVRLLNMDMQELDFPVGHFDAACCSFGVFFVEDMEAQVRHIAGKVKKGGRFLMTTFDENTFSPLADKLFGRLNEYGVDAPPEGKKRLYTPEQCTTLFEGAGLGDVSVGQEEVGYFLKDAGEWWDVVWNAGFRRFISQIPGDRQDRFRDEHLRDIEALATPEGVWLRVDVLYTTGLVG
jgi:ubiquinone/menaquinone biosynthesis C-methylase UbiE